VTTETYGSYDLPGKMSPVLLWKFLRSDLQKDGNNQWRVGNYGTNISQQEHRNNLNLICDLLNEHEATIAQQRAEMLKVEEQLKSLQEDLKSFSTFEQICNSGMLRNFKIDSESDFAQTILSLLQRTMELQISHLHQKSLPPTKEQNDETPDPDGVHPTGDQQPKGTDGHVPPMEGST
jgi:hypothetical protein